MAHRGEIRLPHTNGRGSMGTKVDCHHSTNVNKSDLPAKDRASCFLLIGQELVAGP